MDNLLNSIYAKVKYGVRINDAEALGLFASNDLLAIGELAALANDRLNGDTVYYNVNRHINYTNLCVNRCTFCAFSRETGDDGGYTLALNDILARAAEAVAAGATELHMVGGLHPDLPFDFYLEMLAAIKADAPQLHLKAFTAVELDYFAQLTGQPVEVLSMTGGIVVAVETAWDGGSALRGGKYLWVYDPVNHLLMGCIARFVIAVVLAVTGVVFFSGMGRRYAKCHQCHDSQYQFLHSISPCSGVLLFHS